MIVETNTCLVEEDGHSDESGGDGLSDHEIDQIQDSGAEADIEAGRPAGSVNREQTIKNQLSEVDAYIDWYMRWRNLAQSKVKKDQEEAKNLREKMKEIEDTVVVTQILPLRQAAIQKMKSIDNQKKEEADLENAIKKEIRKKVGFGLFMSAAKQREEEQKIRASFSEQSKMI